MIVNLKINKIKLTKIETKLNLRAGQKLNNYFKIQEIIIQMNIITMNTVTHKDSKVKNSYGKYLNRKRQQNLLQLTDTEIKSNFIINSITASIPVNRIHKPHKNKNLVKSDIYNLIFSRNENTSE